MRTIAWFAFVCALAVGCRSKEPEPAAGSAIRVGTYHAPSLVVAWVRSEEHAKELSALATARDAALKSGDEAKAAECEKQGAARQELAHRQIAGQAGVEDILARLEKDLPAIRKKAGVQSIHAEGEVLGDRVEFVDVTDLLVEQFHPDEATRKILADVRKHPKGVRVR